MSFRRAARVDRNHTEIVGAFRARGWYVLNVSQLKNCCDIIVSKQGRTIAIEIKDGDTAPSKQRLTEGEMKFAMEWQGDFSIVKSIDDVELIDDLNF